MRLYFSVCGILLQLPLDQSVNLHEVLNCFTLFKFFSLKQVILTFEALKRVTLFNAMTSSPAGLRGIAF